MIWVSLHRKQARTTTLLVQVSLINMNAPTKENYAQWVADRNARTESAIATSTRITGRQIREHNLSARMIFDAGWLFNSVTDTLEKPVIEE